MNIPDQYKWVLNIPNRPKMMDFSLSLVGIKEFPGTGSNNPRIMEMADALGIPRSVYQNDETAWCALVHNFICLKCDKPISYTSAKKDVYDLLRAKSFATWGNEQTVPMFDDTMVFKRPGGYHVAFYVAEDLNYYHILGGNQKNSYSFTRIEKDRLIACRRYYKIGPPASVRQYIVSPKGNISENEA